MSVSHTYKRLSQRVAKITLGCVLSAVVMGCVQNAPDVSRAQGMPTYLGVETRLLDGDLVNFIVSVTGQATKNDVAAYSECAAAQYALIRGFGFARHLRTNVSQEAGIWRADAVYTISSALPDGLRTIDAEVIVSNCREFRIPTV
ncbi:hypothetical protein [Pacificibacter marinus]|uniref:Lipoprotein n=1 Tax=Pacificibacter marinus TaxID=658057 RepID=A0A1Y5SPH3_9RHOB|nr:hypothetical protein SAMN04488032_105171 [Pacificibacter marinus]SLN44802.1 hypothetical protein PAM7971_02155 [Pacificibacter marinus]